MKFWKKIIHLGIKENDFEPYTRYVKLTNSINALIINILITIFIIVKFTDVYDFFPIEIGSGRLLIMSFISLTSLIFSYYKKFTISKLLTSTTLPFVFLVLPYFFKFVEEESYLYYPYMAVGLSLLPLLLFSQKNEKISFWVSFIWCFIIVLISDILILNIDIDFKIIDIVINNYLYYKMVPIALLIFITSAILYLKSINYSFEKNLETKNNELEEKNELLLKISNEIEKQNIELHENQEELETSNEELSEYKHILTIKIKNYLIQLLN